MVEVVLIGAKGLGLVVMKFLGLMLRLTIRRCAWRSRDKRKVAVHRRVEVVDRLD